VAANLNVSLEAESTSNGYLGEGRSRGFKALVRDMIAFFARETPSFTLHSVTAYVP
jgi:hypothetical protein